MNQVIPQQTNNRGFRSGAIASSLRRVFVLAIIGFAWITGAMLPGDALEAQQVEPAVAKNLEVDESKLGSFIPTDVVFYDDDNNFVSIGDYLDQGKPILLSFNYSNCPKLCSVQLTNMVFALKDIEFLPGKDFEIVSVSMDPLEQAVKARETKAKYVALYDNLETADGWHFLTGKQKNIRRLADAVGISYRYIPETKSYSHSAAFVLLSPRGKVSRYVLGLNYEPKEFRQALNEAAEGKIGSTINRGTYLIGCFVHDMFTGQNSPTWMKMMRWGGAITVIVLVVTSIPYFLRGRRNKNAPLSSGRGMPLGGDDVSSPGLSAESGSN